MQELEKILEEMREASVFAKNYDGSVAECVTIGAAERILRKHTKNDGWIPVETWDQVGQMSIEDFI